VLGSTILHSPHSSPKTNTPPSYKNESEVGSAIKTWFSNNPTVRREELFITTKVWPHLMTPSDINFSIRSSLQKLGLDYVDAFLIHWPVVAEKNEELEVKLNEDGGVSPLPSHPSPIPRNRISLTRR
jgi:diketogulonate reductase-like aldo/keto reductase